MIYMHISMQVFSQIYLCYLCTWKSQTKLIWIDTKSYSSNNIFIKSHLTIFSLNNYKLQYFHKDIHLFDNYNSQKYFGRFMRRSTALLRRFKFNVWVKYRWSSVFTIMDTRSRNFVWFFMSGFFLSGPHIKALGRQHG